MLKFALFGLLALVAILLVIIVTRPDEFRVTRSATFAAPAGVVFDQINDLQNWNTWSPWAQMDPNAKYTHEGPQAGVGASLGWAGNNQVGEGRMTITESRPQERVKMRLDFVRPFAGTNTVDFDLKAEGSQTTLSWSMLGKANFMSKAIGLFMNCEDMLGRQFEQGFANLRKIVEPAAKG